MIRSIAFEFNVYCIMIIGGNSFGNVYFHVDISCGNWFVYM